MEKKDKKRRRSVRILSQTIEKEEVENALIDNFEDKYGSIGKDLSPGYVSSRRKSTTGRRSGIFKTLSGLPLEPEEQVEEQEEPVCPILEVCSPELERGPDNLSANNSLNVKINTSSTTPVLFHCGKDDSSTLQTTPSECETPKSFSGKGKNDVILTPLDAHNKENSLIEFESPDYPEGIFITQDTRQTSICQSPLLASSIIKEKFSLTPQLKKSDTEYRTPHANLKIDDESIAYSPSQPIFSTPTLNLQKSSSEETSSTSLVKDVSKPFPTQNLFTHGNSLSDNEDTVSKNSFVTSRLSNKKVKQKQMEEDEISNKEDHEKKETSRFFAICKSLATKIANVVRKSPENESENQTTNLENTMQEYLPNSEHLSKETKDDADNTNLNINCETKLEFEKESHNEKCGNTGFQGNSSVSTTNQIEINAQVASKDSSDLKSSDDLVDTISYESSKLSTDSVQNAGSQNDKDRPSCMENFTQLKSCDVEKETEKMAEMKTSLVADCQNICSTEQEKDICLKDIEKEMEVDKLKQENPVKKRGRPRRKSLGQPSLRSLNTAVLSDVKAGPSSNVEEEIRISSSFFLSNEVDSSTTDNLVVVESIENNKSEENVEKNEKTKKIENSEDLSDRNVDADKQIQANVDESAVNISKKKRGRPRRKSADPRLLSNISMSLMESEAKMSDKNSAVLTNLKNSVNSASTVNDLEQKGIDILITEPENIAELPISLVNVDISSEKNRDKISHNDENLEQLEQKNIVSINEKEQNSVSDVAIEDEEGETSKKKRGRPARRRSADPVLLACLNEVSSSAIADETQKLLEEISNDDFNKIKEFLTMDDAKPQPSKKKGRRRSADSVSLIENTSEVLEEEQIEVSNRRSSRTKRRSIELYQAGDCSYQNGDSESPIASSPSCADDNDSPSASGNEANTKKPSRKRKLKEENIEDIYRNKNFKAPGERIWETIYESPETLKNPDQLLSKKRFKRCIAFETLLPAKIKKRAKKAADLGWDAKKRKKHQLPDEVVIEKISDLDKILSS